MKIELSVEVDVFQGTGSGLYFENAQALFNLIGSRLEYDLYNTGQEKDLCVRVSTKNGEPVACVSFFYENGAPIEKEGNIPLLVIDRYLKRDGRFEEFVTYLQPDGKRLDVFVRPKLETEGTQ